MSKKRVGMAIAMVAVLGFGFILYRQAAPDEYAPADDEIALCIQLAIKEDIGLLLIDYKDANGSGGQGGVSNADKTLLEQGDQLFYTLPMHAFDNPSDVENLSIRFTIVTEYVEPNFEEIYPEEYKIPIDVLFLKTHFGESHSIIISGDKANGYRATLEDSKGEDTFRVSNI